MKWVLSVFAGITFLSGLFGTLGAKTVFQQIEGGISFVISAVLFSGVGIIEAIGRAERNLSDNILQKLLHR